jgi:hypothetical protein
MPKGKGTYGSQVGRPPKKKVEQKYHIGGHVTPMSDGAARSVTNYAGDGLTGFNKIGQQIPNQPTIVSANDYGVQEPLMEENEVNPLAGNVPMYKEGGPVEDKEAARIALMDKIDKVEAQYWKSYYKGEKVAKEKWSKRKAKGEVEDVEKLEDPNFARKAATAVHKKRLDRLKKKLKDRDY